MNVEVELDRESGYVSDASVLVAEKLLARTGRTGKFNRLGEENKSGHLLCV
jgi:hypothetical protein